MLKHNFSEDTLDREELAKHYATFLNTKGINNLTVALDSAWGTGKSKLIDFMCDELDESESIYITYNAWKNDYTEDPFISLMSEIFYICEDKHYMKSDELKNVKSKTIAASKAIGKGIAKGLVKNVLGSEAISDLSDGIESLAKGAINESSQLIIDGTFKNLQETKKSRDNFTKELKIMIDKIIQEKRKSKFIIIIDELDRCKPTFAISLLEDIKHLFEIDNLVFFIAVDKKQLSESIKSVYGLGFDSTTYLHRFFDVTLYLNHPNEYTDLFLDKLRIINTQLNNIDEILVHAFKELDLNMRSFERIISDVKLLQILNGGSHKINSEIIIGLLIIKYTCKEDVFNNISKLKENKSMQVLDNTLDGYITRRSEILQLFELLRKIPNFFDSNTNFLGLKLTRGTINHLSLINNSLGQF